MANFRVGTLFFLINGTQYALAGDFTINPGGPKRESMMGPDGTRATKETFEPATCEGDLRDNDGLDVQFLKSLQGVTITAQLANGKSWVLVNADQTGDCAVGTAEGTIAVKFEADRAFEQI
jgi:hypothetical protein